MVEITAAHLKKKGRVLAHLADQPEYNSVGYTVYEIKDNMGELNWYVVETGEPITSQTKKEAQDLVEYAKSQNKKRGEPVQETLF